jgi:hypothetical protein
MGKKKSSRRQEISETSIGEEFLVVAIKYVEIEPLDLLNA